MPSLPKIKLRAQKSILNMVPVPLFKEWLGFINTYRLDTDRRVLENPDSAGGLAGVSSIEEKAQLQLDFLIDRGLRSSHQLLELGCNTGGVSTRFIEFLDVGRFTGVDISKEAIAYAFNRCLDERLASKNPLLLLNESGRLNMSFLFPRQYDYIFANSVFSHLPQRHLREIIKVLPCLLKPGGQFYFTYFKVGKGRPAWKQYLYNPGPIFRLAERLGMRFEADIKYYHPRQSMGCISM